MNKIEKEYFRTHLERDIASLEESTAAIKEELKLSGESCANPLMDALDSAKDECDLKSRIRVHNHATANISELRHALRRVASGNFGFCAACGGAIEPGRLEVRPASELCVICQEDRERNFAPRNRMAA